MIRRLSLRLPNGFENLNSIRAFVPRSFDIRISRQFRWRYHHTARTKILDGLGLHWSKANVTSIIRRTQAEGGIAANIFALLIQDYVNVEVELKDQEGIRDLQKSRSTKKYDRQSLKNTAYLRQIYRVPKATGVVLRVGVYFFFKNSEFKSLLISRLVSASYVYATRKFYKLIPEILVLLFDPNIVLYDPKSAVVYTF